ncbi:sensor histidine kinase [Arthrobacter sp. 35W]|uniref:sensor histidine kinase n=1 Tax=Arthrobacter sp. 35W TaxID=1132441 RepID=UPI000414F082|nr:histidine kinase [Arthrobacter sp. 35W]
MSAQDPAPTSSASILRFLRVALHVAFAVLLGVAVLRLLAGGMERPERYLLLIGALVLAAVYLAGTVAEKRFSAGRGRLDPSRYAVLWLAVVTALWGLLLAGHAEFSWLAFPLFFLHLHLLPRAVGLATVALMTAAVVWAQAGAGGGSPATAAVVGPVIGAAFAVATSYAYKLLYRESENQRLAAEELRRTRAELAATQHEAGVLAERGRLAREIHDTLAQGFSSIVLVSRAAEKSLAGGDIASTAESLAMVRQTASENLAEARNFVRGLSSPLLTPARPAPGPAADPAPKDPAPEGRTAVEGAPSVPAAPGPAGTAAAAEPEEDTLVASLRRLCTKTELEAAARGVGLRCCFRVEGAPVDLEQPLKVTLLRAAQASLANVWVHAHATTAVVTLAYLGTEVTLDIYDDGVGFQVPAAGEAVAPRSDGSGFGLRSLRERVAAQHGTLDLESAPGEGAVVAIRLPISGTAPTEEDPTMEASRG